MATQSPFSWLQEALQNFPPTPLKPPAWAVTEAQRRVVLLLNHVLMQEPEAMARLARQKGRVMRVQWRSLSFQLESTPAGLLDLAAPGAKSDLVLTVVDESPWMLVQTALRGDRPAVRIEGDVQLAAEVNWLTEHVRWDLEEDLARVLGDVPAHKLSRLVQSMTAGLRQFLAKAASLVPGPVRP